MKTKILITLGAASVLAAGIVFAQTMDHSGHGAGHGAEHGAGHAMTTGDSPSNAAFAAANAKMHADMNIPLTGNADVDFIAGMIPHHQGAVEMARIVLEFGTDPDVRTLAEQVIVAQEAEIAWMTDWLAKNAQ